MTAEVLNSLIWVGGLILVIGLFTNGFGLFDRTYKGTWVSIKPETFPAVMANLKKHEAFFDSDGLLRELEMKVTYRTDRLDKVTFLYEIKIPKYVFHRVEFSVVLKELEIKR